MDPRTYHQRRELLISKIRRWAEIHGDPPRVDDWRGVSTEEFRRRHGNGWPSYLTVIRYSPDGTWDGMIDAAGFTPRGRGRPGFS